MRRRSILLTASLLAATIGGASAHASTASTTPPGTLPDAPAVPGDAAAVNTALKSPNSFCSAVEVAIWTSFTSATLSSGTGSEDDDPASINLIRVSPLLAVLYHDAAQHPAPGLPAIAPAIFEQFANVLENVVAQMKAAGLSDEIIAKIANASVSPFPSTGTVTFPTIPQITMPAGVTLPAGVTIPKIDIPQITLPDLGLSEIGGGAKLSADEQAQLDAAVAAVTINISEEMDKVATDVSDDGVDTGRLCPAIAALTGDDDSETAGTAVPGT